MPTQVPTVILAEYQIHISVRRYCFCIFHRLSVPSLPHCFLKFSFHCCYNVKLRGGVPPSKVTSTKADQFQYSLSVLISLSTEQLFKNSFFSLTIPRGSYYSLKTHCIEPRENEIPKTMPTKFPYIFSFMGLWYKYIGISL